MCKPDDQLQDTSYCCACKQWFLHQALSHVLLGDKILLLKDMQINYQLICNVCFFGVLIDILSTTIKMRESSFPYK